MNDQTQQALAEAFELIESDKLTEARAILEPMLATHRDNPDVWWLYAHAVADVGEARMALNQVLRLDPEYPEAAKLLNDLNIQTGEPAAGTGDLTPAFPDSFPPMLPDLPEPPMEPAEDLIVQDLEREASVEEEPSGMRLVLLGALGLLALAALVAIAVLTSQPRGTAPTPTPEVIGAAPTSTPLAIVPEETAAATMELPPETATDETAAASEEAEAATEAAASVEATEAATEAAGAAVEKTEVASAQTAEPEATEASSAAEATPSVEPTSAPTSTPVEPTAVPSDTPTEEAMATATPPPAPTRRVTLAASTPLEGYVLALSDYGVGASGVGIEETEQGNTVIANICTAPGTELRSKLPAVMDVLARQPAPGEVEALGTRMVNCPDSTNTELLLIVVSVADAQAYASGSLSEEEFQARWKSF